MLPTKIKVWAHELEIKKEANPTYANDKGGANPLYGSVNYDTMKIVLREDLPITREAETLIHELLHLIGYFTNTFNDIKEHEEKIVDNTSNGLYLLFKDNPELLDYLKESIKNDIQ